MADRLIKINEQNWVMASSVSRVERGAYDNVYVWAEGIQHCLEPGYGEPSYKALARIVETINAALGDA